MCVYIIYMCVFVCVIISWFSVLFIKGFPSVFFFFFSLIFQVPVFCCCFIVFFGLFLIILIFCRIQDAVKIMAKDLVRTRHYIKKFILMKANIQAVSLKIQTLRSNNAMAQAMKGVTRAMQTMNKQVSPTKNSSL